MSTLKVRISIPGLPKVAAFLIPTTVEELAAGVFDMTDPDQVETSEDVELAELALSVLAGFGGIALAARAQDISLSAWSGEMSVEEVARFNAIAARLAGVFATAGQEAS